VFAISLLNIVVSIHSAGLVNHWCLACCTTPTRRFACCRANARSM